MTGFLVRRLLQALGVVALMSFLVYALIGLMPGDPIDLMISADPDLTSEDAARLKELGVRRVVGRLAVNDRGFPLLSHLAMRSGVCEASEDEGGGFGHGVSPG